MFNQDRDLKFNPDLKDVLSNHMSRYSLVRATAKRAREISEEAEEEKIILTEKPYVKYTINFRYFWIFN